MATEDFDDRRKAQRGGVGADATSSSTRATDPSLCVVCGGETRDEVARPASTYAAKGDYRIATCVKCGSGQTMPRPSGPELDAFYSKDYRYDAHVLIASEKRWRARQILDIAAGPTPGRVLDIGCMYGYLLKEARARGAKAAVGVELSAAPAAAARAEGLDVFCGTIEKFAASAPEPFDLVIAQHVLEHVTDLSSFVASIRRLLTPNGVTCICVPNYGARARRVFREAWGWYQVPVHVHHFVERGLAELLEQHGFDIVRTERRGGDSLMVLMTLLQSIGRMPKSDAVEAPGILTRTMLRTASALLRPYYYVGDDELLVIARPREKSGAN